MDSSATFALQMFATALAITIGIFSGNLLVPISSLVTSTPSLAVAAAIAPPPIPFKPMTPRGVSQSDHIVITREGEFPVKTSAHAEAMPSQEEVSDSTEDRLNAAASLIDLRH